MSICKVDDCESLTVCKELCPKHYTRLRKHGDVHTVLIGGGVCSIVDCGEKSRSWGLCKKHYSKEWRRRNRDKSREMGRKYYHQRLKHDSDYMEVSKQRCLKRTQKINFGGNREKAIQRDNERCVWCGITREKHKEKYNCDLAVDHIDGNGRYSDKKNHDLDNLQTMCLVCHGKKSHYLEQRTQGSNRRSNGKDKR